jgi:hypothetical protein
LWGIHYADTNFGERDMGKWRLVNPGFWKLQQYESIPQHLPLLIGFVSQFDHVELCGSNNLKTTPRGGTHRG